MNSNKCPSKVWLSTQILKNFSCAIYTDCFYQEGYGLYLRRCPNSAIIGRYLFVGVVSIIVHIHVCDRDLWSKSRWERKNNKHLAAGTYTERRTYIRMRVFVLWRGICLAYSGIAYIILLCIRHIGAGHCRERP